jgi:hypothetical protein
MLAAFMLLFGVLIFSYIMNEYVALLEKYKDFVAEYDNGDQLRMFFGVLKHFNKNEDISFKRKKKFEAYFTYSWNNYKNLIILDSADQELFE